MLNMFQLDQAFLNHQLCHCQKRRKHDLKTMSIIMCKSNCDMKAISDLKEQSTMEHSTCQAEINPEGSSNSQILLPRVIFLHTISQSLMGCCGVKEEGCMDMLFMICAALQHKEVCFHGGCNCSLLALSCCALSCCTLSLRASLVPASSQGSLPSSWALSYLTGAQTVRGLASLCGATLPPPVSCLQGAGWAWLQMAHSAFCSAAGGKAPSKSGKRGRKDPCHLQGGEGSS